MEVVKGRKSVDENHAGKLVGQDKKLLLLKIGYRLILLRNKSGRAYAKKDQIPITGVGDTLGCIRGNDDHVSRSDLRRGKISNLDYACSFRNDISFNRVLQTVAGCRNAGTNPGPGNGYVSIFRPIPYLQDEAAFFSKELTWPFCFDQQFLH
jgi:hypothetical protein